MVFDISDIQLLPVIVALALPLAGVVIFLLFKFMMKEKTYEEALAEQRILTNELLGVNQKPKEKKSKKAKKNKEKPAEDSPTTTTELESTFDVANSHDNLDTHNSKPHVEFVEEAQELEVSPETVPNVAVQNKKSMKKVRPILVKKENSIESPVKHSLPVEAPPANHFEQIHPKDEFELLRANTREDIAKSEQTKEKHSKEKKQSADTDHGNKKVKQEKIIVKNIDVPAPNINLDNVEKPIEPTAVHQNIEAIAGSGKEKKKKKTEYNAKQQLAVEGDQLITLVRKAELSRTEIQNLIDLLLNKQLEAPEVSNEWSEGKSDPIQKLKKQLAEKEKLLAEEQEALLGAQTKLKEVRSEQLSERSQLQQKMRGYEEALQQKQLEVQAANNRVQVNGQKIQQLQAQLNDEVMTKHKLIEENKTFQIQRQQLEVRLVQFQEAEGLIIKLNNDNEEFARQSQHLSMELQRLSQEMAADKEHQHAFALQKQGEIEQLSEHNRQLEEACKDLQGKLEVMIQQETDWKHENSKLNSALKQRFEEKRRLDSNLQQVLEEVLALRKDKSDMERMVSQLNTDLQKVREEKSTEMNGTAKDSKEQEIKVLNLTNELSSLKTELFTVNSDFSESKRRYKNELEITGNAIAKLESELKEQKEKNNELRKKNWKVMEALNTAENKAKTTVPNKQKDVDLDKLISEARKHEREAQKQFIQRLFPEIQESLKNINSADWQDRCSEIVKNYIHNLQKKQTLSSSQESRQKSSNTLKLQAEVTHYQKAIDELEDVLAGLQSRIGLQEIEWQRKLNEKTAKIEELQNLLLDKSKPICKRDSFGVEFAYKCVEKSLPFIIDELQVKILKLEKKITQLEHENIMLNGQNQELKQYMSVVSNKPEIKSVHVDATTTIEKLSEEVNRLRELLAVEQCKSDDLNVKLKAQNISSSSNNGPSYLEGKGDS